MPAISIASARASLEVVSSAPATILVCDVFGKPLGAERGQMEWINGVLDIQSVGAAIQNMLLAAVGSRDGTPCRWTNFAPAAGVVRKKAAFQRDSIQLVEFASGKLPGNSCRAIGLYSVR